MVRGPYDTKSKTIPSKPIEMMIAQSVPQVEIARVFGISLATLKRRFADHLSSAKIRGAAMKNQRLSDAVEYALQNQ